MTATPEPLYVMSFNLWHGGDAGRQPLEQSAEVIRAAGADIVGLQETHGLTEAFFKMFPGETQPTLVWPDPPVERPDNGARLAEILGWQYFDQGNRRGILTRFSIAETTPMKWGAKIGLTSGRQVYMFNAHLAYWPYQPYQVRKLPYFGQPDLENEEQVIQAAREARGVEVSEMLDELHRFALSSSEPLPTFLTGDFNEPSHLDWTAAAVASGRFPYKVAYPSTKAVVDAGMQDTFRTLNPDEVQKPGFTWTPLTRVDDPADQHDRIDFVFMAGANVELQSVRIVGESPEWADVVVTPYPSDHRSVVSGFLLR